MQYVWTEYTLDESHESACMASIIDKPIIWIATRINCKLLNAKTGFLCAIILVQHRLPDCKATFENA
jgi:hypothetical protein